MKAEKDNSLTCNALELKKYSTLEKLICLTFVEEKVVLFYAEHNCCIGCIIANCGGGSVINRLLLTKSCTIFAALREGGCFLLNHKTTGSKPEMLGL